MLNVLCVLLQSDPLLKYMKVESTKIPLAESRAVSKVKDHTHKSLKNQGLTLFIQSVPSAEKCVFQNLRKYLIILQTLSAEAFIKNILK